jgi:hypothetical protein
MTDKFNKPLNQFIEEEVEITTMTPVVDQESSRVTFKMGKEKALQKTYYASSTPKMIICKDHSYKPLDPKRYIFKCEKCDWHYKAMPVTHKYHPEDNTLRLRSNGQKV